MNTSNKLETSYTDQELIKQLPGFTNEYAHVNGVALHYVVGGTGSPLLLLPGWPHTWWTYRKVMQDLAGKFTVLAVDLRGMGSSDKPEEGYDKKTMAQDVYELVASLGYAKVGVVGHDIGAMVAYSFAQQYPEAITKLVLLDAMHPEESLYSLTLLPQPGTFSNAAKANPTAPYLWWFAFHQIKGLPERLLLGRFRLELDWFFTYLLADEEAINEFDRSVYAFAYDSLDGIRAANAWFQAFEQDIEDQKTYPLLQVPTLAIAGTSADWIRYVLPTKIENPTVVSLACGHFPAEELPTDTIKHLLDFMA